MIKIISTTVICLVQLLSLNNLVYAHADSHEHSKTPTSHHKGSSWASHMGSSHGEIAISKSGDIYVSTLEPNKGVLVYAADGTFKRAIPSAPSDFHGFLIREENGIEYIYAARLNGQSILKMNLAGHWIMEIPGTRIPSKYYNPNKKYTELQLTGIDVDDNGNIYVVDGYGIDNIHKFDAKGKYLTTFVGKEAPYNFLNCHKIFIDPRFSPKRLMCTDRLNKRLVHIGLDGKLIGDHATNLRLPSGVTFYKDYAAIAEIAGRVSIIDKNGKIVAVLSINDATEEINTPLTPPEKWGKGVVTSPHGIAFDSAGNLYVTEWNNYGRVLKFNTKFIEESINKAQ